MTNKNEHCETCGEPLGPATHSTHMGRYATCPNGHTWSLA